MENVYQHFRKEEQDFIDHALDWVRRVVDQYSPYLTKFLDPREYYILESIAGQYSEITVYSWGGHEEAERKRVLLAPPYIDPTETEYGLSLIEIDYPKKFVELSHGKILGSLLSSGIKRETIGDIITDGEHWQFFVDNTIESYLMKQVDKIGKATVHLEKKTLAERIFVIDQWEIRTEIVSSLRLDVVLAAVLHLSRGRVKDLISSNRVKVNWTEMTRPDTELEMNDVLSVRGFGRIKIREIQGRTKKDKYLLEIGVLDRNR